ncbi:MAG: response regulator [Nitrospirae bacterium]|nr:response regulator [Nitrospirota bacterium]
MTNIMVVDDSPTTRQLITFVLKRLTSSNIVEATDGADALKKLSSGVFDLILADINMPVIDGLKLISLLRNDPKYKTTPIVIITTEGAEEDRKKAMAIGANAYITKPIQTQELIKTINQILKL